MIDIVGLSLPAQRNSCHFGAAQAVRRAGNWVDVGRPRGHRRERLNHAPISFAKTTPRLQRGKLIVAR